MTSDDEIVADPSIDDVVLQSRIQRLESELAYLRGRHYALAAITAVTAKKGGVDFSRFSELGDFMVEVAELIYPNVSEIERQGIRECLESFHRLDSTHWPGT